MEPIEANHPDLVDRFRIRNKARIEILLYKKDFRIQPTDLGLYKNLKIPDFEIRIGVGELGLSFLDRGNLFYYSHSVTEVERVLDYIETKWEQEGKRGLDIPFSRYLQVASNRNHEAA